MPVTKRVENVKRIVSNKFVQKESGKNQLVTPVAQAKRKRRWGMQMKKKYYCKMYLLSSSYQS